MLRNILFSCVILAAAIISADQVNVRDFGARGDGKADDSAAFHQALAKAISVKGGGALYIPAGTYLISQTLKIEKCRGLKIFGDGFSGLQPPGRPFPEGRNSSSNIVWNGSKGGTLFEVHGSGGLSIQDLSLAGSMKADKDAECAGTLIHMRHTPGFGQMINTITNTSFFFADTAIKMANDTGEHTCSDMHLNNILFRGLGTGFQVLNDQGVDYTFTFLFANDVNTVLDFQRGGNLLVNTSQMTNCDLFLNISGGGRNAGVYQLNNVRQEATHGGGSKKRDALLRSYPSHRQALVRFTNFNDVQWNWHNNQTAERGKPLCDIGPGSTVIFESSIFNSPLASLTGSPGVFARLIVRNSCFSYAMPKESVSAGEHAEYKLTDNFTDTMQLLPDHVKWSNN